MKGRFWEEWSTRNASDGNTVKYEASTFISNIRWIIKDGIYCDRKQSALKLINFKLMEGI